MCLACTICSPKVASKAAMPLRCNKSLLFLILATNAFWADIANTLSGDMPSWCAVMLTCFSISFNTSCLGFKSSHSMSILFSSANLYLARPLIKSFQICISDCVMPVSTAVKNKIACALGIILSVNSGSAPSVFRPGVSSTTKPLFKSGCG